MRTKGVLLHGADDVLRLLREKGVKKPMIVCGKSFLNTGLMRQLSAFSPVVFSDVRPNPRFEDMQTARDLFVENGCDFLIGAGGGSPLDSAKMVKLMVTNPEETWLTGMAANDIGFLAVPTTSGTGSEATRYSIFYIGDKKYSVSNADFLADYVLLEPAFLQTVPLYQRKCTCLDALCHAIESYWSVRAGAESRAYAEKAIGLFWQALDGYMQNEPQGNRDMLLASYWAGKAIDCTATTAGHALCYNLTIYCHTAHGHSVALCMRSLWQYMLSHPDLPVNDARGNAYVQATLTALGRMMGGSTAADGAVVFEKLLQRFALETPVMPAGTPEAFAQKVDVSRLSNNPLALSTSDVIHIYSRIFS